MSTDSITSQIEGRVEKWMEKLEVIVSVDEPTDWCSGLVIVPKLNGQIKLCVDYIQLNCWMRREIHPLSSMENLFAQIQDKYFSKIDGKYGFWQFRLTRKANY